MQNHNSTFVEGKIELDFQLKTITSKLFYACWPHIRTHTRAHTYIAALVQKLISIIFVIYML